MVDKEFVSEIQSLKLSNGLKASWENIPHIHSLLLGVWVCRGSRHEPQSLFGISHFLEHMLFKGTQKRSSLQIAESLETVGGELNAFTSRENCCYYAKAVIHHYPLVFDILTDLMFQSVFDSLEIEREKKVICQEIDMYEDSPEELSHDLIVQSMYSEALGHPVVGTPEQVLGFKRDEVLGFHQKSYAPNQILVTMVGNFSAMNPENEIRKWFEELPSGPDLPDYPEEEKHQEVVFRSKKIEQLHLNLGWHALSMTHPSRYALHLISSWLGGGMSSTLFQEIREIRGLAYSIYSYVRAYSDGGSIGIASAQAPETQEEVLNAIAEIIERLIQEGIPSLKLEQLKSQLTGSLLLGLEKTSFRMNRIAVGEMHFGRVHSAQELMDLVHQVRPEEILQTARTLFAPVPTIIGVGPGSKKTFLAAIRRSRYAKALA